MCPTLSVVRRRSKGTDRVVSVSSKMFEDNNFSSPPISILCLSVVFSVFVFLVCLFYVPVYWIRKLEDLKPTKGKVTKSRSSLLRKLPPPYPNGWFAIAESKEIKAGAAESIECLGETFVVFRSTSTGEVFVLDAFCPHLGANTGIGGIVEDNCILCPFHHWKFSGQDGACIEIPYSDSVVEKTARLKKWRSVEVNSLIFVWYHAENEEPWELPEISEISSGEWSFHGKNEFIVNCHIQDVPENGADVAHLQAVHEPSVTTGSDVRYTRSRWLFNQLFGSHIWKANWSPDADDKHTANIILTHSLNIGKFEFMKVTADIQQIGPACVVLYLNSTFGRMVIVQTLTPLAPLKQKLCHYFYGPRLLAWFIKFTVIAESINVSRDIMIWNYKQFVSNPVLPKEDKLIKQFRTWFSQFYSENSKSFEMAKNDLSW